LAGARELYLVLRARNETRAAFREVARDVRALPEAKAIETGQRQAQLASQALRNRQADLIAQRESLQYGEARYALSTRMLRAENALNEARAREGRNDLARLKIEEDIVRAQVRQRQLARTATRSPNQLARRGLTQADVRTLARAEEVTIARLGRQQEDLAANTLRTARHTEVFTRRVQEAGDAITLADAKVNKLSRDIGHLGERIEFAEMKEASFAARLRALPSQQMRTLATAVEHVGRSMLTVGVVGTAGIGMAAKSFADFSRQATFAATQTVAINASVAQVQRNAAVIRREVESQMTQFPASAEEMTKAIYDINSSMNITFPQSIEMLKLFNTAAMAGQAPLEDVSQALIVVGNNWKISANDMKAWESLASSVMATVRFGFLDLKDYVSMQNQLANSFRAARQPIEQMNAAIAVTSRYLHSPSMVSAGLARLVETLQNPKLQEGLQAGLKIDIAPGGNLLPLQQVIEMIIKAKPEILESGTALNNFFKEYGGTMSTIQSRRVFRILIQQHKEYSALLKQTSGDMQELTRSAAAMRADPGTQWQLFANNLKVLVMIIGEGAVPAFTALQNILIPVVNWMARLSPGTQHAIGYFTAISGILLIVGGGFLFFAGAIARSILSLREMLPLIRGAIAGARGLQVAEAALAAETGAISVSMGLWLGGITALLIALPLLNKITGDWTTTIELLVGIFGVFLALRVAVTIGTWISSFVAARLAMMAMAATAAETTGGIAAITAAMRGMSIASLGAAVGMTGPLAVAAVAIGATYALAKGFESSQKQVIAAEMRINKWSDRSVIGIGKMINAWKRHGATSTQVFNNLKARLGDSQNAYELMAGAMEFANKHGEVYLRQQAAIAKAERERAEARKRAGAAPGITGLTAAEAIQMAIRIDRLTKAAQAMHPGPAAFAAWQRVGKLTKDFQGLTTKAQQDIIGKMNLDSVVLMNEQAFRRAYAQLETLRRQAEAHPRDMALQERYLRQREALEKRASSVQMQAAAIAYAYESKLSDAAFLKRAAQVQALQNLAKRDPTFENIKRATIAMDALQKVAGPGQMEAWQQMQNTQIHISDQAALALGRRVKLLRDTFERSPSLARWLAWYRANEQLTTQLSDKQKQMVQDLVDAMKVTTQMTNAEFRRRYAAVERIHTQATNAIKRNDAGAFELSVKYHTALDKLNEDSTSAQMAAMDDVHAKQEKLQNDAVKNARENVNNIVQTFVSTYEGFRQQNQQMMGTLFQGPFSQTGMQQLRREWGQTTTGGDLTRDLQSQVTGFERFHGSLGRLARRGAPRQLTEQIRQMGPEAQQSVDSLLRMSPTQWRRYVQIFQRGQQLIERATKRQMDSQIQQWFQHGRAVAGAIIRGISSQDVRLQAAMKNLVLQLFPGLAGKAQLTPATATAGGGGNTYNYTIHAERGSHVTLPTQLRKLHMLDKNRRAPRAR
jgi:hypothetical protein